MACLSAGNASILDTREARERDDVITTGLYDVTYDFFFSLSLYRAHCLRGEKDPRTEEVKSGRTLCDTRREKSGMEALEEKLKVQREVRVVRSL
ncbi:hypothetical protein BaRGS_00016714 [Batillaria attramentaria]|uniref:Uncharacterized protein n=1 Tax=Batillaria attramentaria TaxID=370345 RepID=A0ABD0KY29_9CAEN